MYSVDDHCWHVHTVPLLLLKVSSVLHSQVVLRLEVEVVVVAGFGWLLGVLPGLCPYLLLAYHLYRGLLLLFLFQVEVSMRRRKSLR